MPVEISVLAGREPELDWLGNGLASARNLRLPMQHLHMYGPKGIGVSSLLNAFLHGLKAEGAPTVVYRFAGMFRFAPLPDCMGGLLRDPQWIGLHPPSGYKEAETELMSLIEQRRREVLADGGLILYRSGGDYLAAGQQPRTSGGQSFRRRISAALPTLWTEAFNSLSGQRGALLVIFEQWRSNPADFEDWVTTDFSAAVRASVLPWPMLVLTTGRTALDPRMAGPIFTENFAQKEIPPLPRADFFNILEKRGYDREAWDWLFAECRGMPGGLSHAWERWNRYQNVHLSAHEELVALLPHSFRRPITPRESLWIQAAAAFSRCDEEALALVVGRREASHAVAYLSSVSAIRTVSGGLLLDPALRVAILAWMRVHHPFLLEECGHGAALLQVLDELVPRREDRSFLSALAPVKQFDTTLLEAIFPG